MNMPCKDCLTYMMCKNRFEEILIRNLIVQPEVYAIMNSFNVIVSAVNCEIGKRYMELLLNNSDDIDLNNMALENMSKEILKTFRLRIHISSLLPIERESDDPWISHA